MGHKIIEHEKHLGAVGDYLQKFKDFYGSDQPRANGGDARKFCGHLINQHANNGEELETCVTCSFVKAIQNGALAEGVVLPEPSWWFTALDSNTNPDTGNSDGNVMASIMKHGLRAESDCPSIFATKTQFYDKSSLPDAILKPNILDQYNLEVLFVWLPIDGKGNAIQKDLSAATALCANVVISIDGREAKNDLGQIIRTTDQDSHDIFEVFDKSAGENYKVAEDSENPYNLDILAPDYSEHYPVWVLVKKKAQTYPFIKVGGSIAFLSKSPNSLNEYVAYDSGETCLAINGKYPKAVTLASWPINYKGKKLFIQ